LAGLAGLPVVGTDSGVCPIGWPAPQAIERMIRETTNIAGNKEDFKYILSL
jgi:hypothetical protein